MSFKSWDSIIQLFQNIYFPSSGNTKKGFEKLFQKYLDRLYT